MWIYTQASCSLSVPDPKDVDPNACPRWLSEAFGKICAIFLVRLLVGVKRAWISITFFYFYFFSYEVVVLYTFVKLKIMDASSQSAMIHC